VVVVYDPRVNRIDSCPNLPSKGYKAAAVTCVFLGCEIMELY
jgi:hypothetical protein